MCTFRTMAATATVERVEFRAQPGFQERYLSNPADIVIGGGAAGAGKSFAAVLDPLRHKDVAGFSGVFFRRTGPELTGPGSIWEEATNIYPHFGGKMRGGHFLDVRFPSGAHLKFSHMQYAEDRLQHQSKQYAFIHFEELTHFEDIQFWYMVSRARSACGVRPYIRGNCNPDPDSFVAKLVEWWIDQTTGLPIWDRAGVLRWFVRDGDEMVWADTKQELVEEYGENRPMSFAFVPGTLEDNKILMNADPGYETKLMALPRVEREQLRFGNWLVRPKAGMYFPRHRFIVIDSLDEMPARVRRAVRFWDKAASEPSETNKDPDFTAGVKMGATKEGDVVVMDIIHDRGTPGKVDNWMKSAARRDKEHVRIGCFQDPGQAGVVDMGHIKKLLRGFRVKFLRTAAARRGTKGGKGSGAAKVAQAGPLASHAEERGIYVLRGPWNDALFSEGDAFPDGKHDDIIDAMSGAYLLLQTGRKLAWA